MDVVLKATDPIEQPVGLAKALTGFGLTLAEAHDALNRLVAGETVPVTLHLTESGETPFALCRFGLSLGEPIETPTPRVSDRAGPVVGSAAAETPSREREPS